MEYITTEDPNIIKQIKTVESEIYIDKLELEIKSLEKTENVLLRYPEKASLELKQAVDMCNEPEIAMQIQNEIELEEKKDLLNKCKTAK